MQKLVITRAHFQCGPLVAPTEIKFTTGDGGELIWKGMVLRVDEPVAVEVPGDDPVVHIEHCTMSSVSICIPERLMRTIRHTFEVVKLSHKHTAPCGKCGVKCSRTKEFMQTLNPFNTNTDGSLKTRDQIMVELRAKVAEYRTQTIYHAKCED
jgi:transcription elongation factor Elf1